MRRTSNKLLDSLATKAKVETKGKVERPVLELTPEVQREFVDLCRVHSVHEILDSQHEQMKKSVGKKIFDLWIQKLWESRSVPANPALLVKKNGKDDISATFIIQGGSKFKVAIPETTDETSLEEKLVGVLTSVGLTEENANSLVQNEIDLKPQVCLKSLDSLLDGYYGKGNEWVESTAIEKASANKLMQFLQARRGKIDYLTDEEAQACIYTKPQIKVNKDFLAKVCDYCENLEQLRGVFDVITPVFYAKSMKFAISDSAEDRKKRMEETVNEFLVIS